MLDFLPIWRDTEAIRNSSIDGFSSQFGKLQSKLHVYLRLLFPTIGLVSMSSTAGGCVGVCSFVSNEISGVRFECKFVLDARGLTVKISVGSGLPGRFVRDQSEPTEIIHVDESLSWSDLSIEIFDTICKMLVLIDSKNQTKA